MKKIFSALIVLLVAASLFAGGGKDKAANTLTVGATPEPHAEMLKLVVDDLAAQGITLKVLEFTDYVTPNEALESGQIDANFFQHLPYRIRQSGSFVQAFDHVIKDLFIDFQTLLKCRSKTGGISKIGSVGFEHFFFACNKFTRHTVQCISPAGGRKRTQRAGSNSGLACHVFNYRHHITPLSKFIGKIF